MHDRKMVLALSVMVFSLASSAQAASRYDAMVLQDRPVLFLPLSSAQGNPVEPDLSGNANTGRYFPATRLPAKTRMPNGDYATVFDGFTQHLEVRSSAALSIPRGGVLTIEAWIRPDTLEFPSQESDGYVHWAGKGESGQHEYALRMYSLTNSASRPNRISAYVFNPSGGLGSGSYFQDPVRVRRWVHVAVIVDTQNVKLFKNAVLRDTTPLSQFNVNPQPGSAPLRIGTRDLRSYFKGGIAKFALYHYPLTVAQLHRHFMEIGKYRE